MKNRGAKRMPVAGEMVAEREATRSMSRDISNVDVSSLDTAAAVEKQKREEKGCQDLSSRSNSDQKMRTMFNKWAEMYKKEYSTEKEREERFHIFCSTKKYIDKKRSKRPGSWPSGLSGLNKFADLRYSEMPHRAREDDCLHSDYPYDDPKYFRSMEKVHPEELEEARIEFEKWVQKHRRVYDTEDEQKKRLSIFLFNKTKIDEFSKENPGSWTKGYDIDAMDKMTCEVVVKQVS